MSFQREFYALHKSLYGLSSYLWWLKSYCILKIWHNKSHLVTEFNVFYFYHHHIFVIITVIIVIIIDIIVIINIIISNNIVFTILLMLLLLTSHCTWQTYNKFWTNNINIYKTSSKNLFRKICSNVISNYLLIEWLKNIFCKSLSFIWNLMSNVAI